MLTEKLQGSPYHPKMHDPLRSRFHERQEIRRCHPRRNRQYRQSIIVSTELRLILAVLEALVCRLVVRSGGRFPKNVDNSLREIRRPVRLVFGFLLDWFLHKLAYDWATWRDGVSSTKKYMQMSEPSDLDCGYPSLFRFH